MNVSAARAKPPVPVAPPPAAQARAVQATAKDADGDKDGTVRKAAQTSATQAQSAVVAQSAAASGKVDTFA